MKQCPHCKSTHPDEEVFCPECGAQLVLLRERSKLSQISLIIIAVLLAGVLVGMAYFFYKTRSEELRWADMQSELSQVEDRLEEAEAERKQAETRLKQAKTGWDEAEAGLDEAETGRKQAEAERDQAQEQLAQTQTRLKKAESDWESFLDLAGECRCGTDNYYADTYILVLEKNETKRVGIHWNNHGTVTLEGSDELDCKWAGEWSGSGTEAIIKGTASGYYKVKFTNNQNDDAFDILVLVKG